MQDNQLEDVLYHYFTQLWSADTCYTPDLWSSENPALGQCVPTVLIIQDNYGGEIKRGTVHLIDGRTESHYWNIINNQIVDITIVQYGDKIIKVTPRSDMPEGFSTLRGFVLANADTKRRYDLLKKKAKPLP